MDQTIIHLNNLFKHAHKYRNKTSVFTNESVNHLIKWFVHRIVQEQNSYYFAWCCNDSAVALFGTLFLDGAKILPILYTNVRWLIFRFCLCNWGIKAISHNLVFFSSKLRTELYFLLKHTTPCYQFPVAPWWFFSLREKMYMWRENSVNCVSLTCESWQPRNSR